jgi:hypothetical protein
MQTRQPPSGNFAGPFSRTPRTGNAGFPASDPEERPGVLGPVSREHDLGPRSYDAGFRAVGLRRQRQTIC